MQDSMLSSDLKSAREYIDYNESLAKLGALIKGNPTDLVNKAEAYSNHKVDINGNAKSHSSLNPLDIIDDASFDTSSLDNISV